MGHLHECEVAAPRVLAPWGGRYRVFETLGTGAMGTVYRAHDPVLGRAVAIKRIHPHLASSRRFVSALLREARAGCTVSHPNIARTTDFRYEPDTGTCFLVMERLQGGSLESVLQEMPRPPLEWTLHVVAQTLAALAAAHDHGIIHRDVKPDNVMLQRVLDDDGRAADQVKVCDFGIARVTGVPLRDEEGRPLTFHGMPCGTPGYVAPEQMAGRDIDQRVDIHAAGVMLHEMVTGQAPFYCDETLDPEEVHARPLVLPSLLRPDIPPGLEHVIVRATALDPNDRYSDAREMRAELLACLPEGRRVTYAPPLEGIGREREEVWPVADPFEGDRTSDVRPHLIELDAGAIDPEIAAPECRPVSTPKWPFVLAACSALALGSALASPETAMAWLQAVEVPTRGSVTSYLVALKGVFQP